MSDYAAGWAADFESARMLARVAAWCLVGGSLAGVLGMIVLPLVILVPGAFAVAWVISLVVLAQTRSVIVSIRRIGSAAPASFGLGRALLDFVLTVFGGTALAPLSTVLIEGAGLPGGLFGELGTRPAGTRILRIGAWIAATMGACLLAAVGISLVWAYQQSQREDLGPDAWFVFAPIVAAFLGLWLVMTVNGITTLICLRGLRRRSLS